ncbi:hypothetical protein [Streptomyces sp. SCL15-4]|uniref:hypothetical protein n=1 Tax=Streptomyces sp. SCL15-4 TaxID=2967221 RepID=UPI002966ADE9|nr:hypothetical protein [Streptomyces sp. SCL15-4]
MGVRSRLAAVGTEPEGWAAARVGGAPEAVFETVAAEGRRPAPGPHAHPAREAIVSGASFVAAPGRRRRRTPAAAGSRPRPARSGSAHRDWFTLPRDAVRGAPLGAKAGAPPERTGPAARLFATAR